MTPLAVAGIALHRAAGVCEVRLATYQSVSGAGRAALEEFFQTASLGRLSMKDRSCPPSGQAPGPGPSPATSSPGRQVRRGGFPARAQSRVRAAQVWAAPNMAVSAAAARAQVRGHSCPRG